MPPPAGIPKGRKRAAAVRFEVSGRSLLWIVAAVGSIWLLTQIWPIVLILVGALILVGTLNPFAASLQRRGFNRPLAVVTVFLALLAVLGLMLLLVVPPLTSQLAALWAAAPSMQAQLADQLARRPLTRAMSEPVRHFKPVELIATHGEEVFAYSAASAVGFGIAGTILALAFYILVDPTRHLELLFALVPRAHHVKTATILGKLESIVGGYMRGQVITSGAITVYVLGILWALGVEAPIPLALLAGLADVLPFVGGLLSALPASLAALALGPRVALGVFAAMLLYQEFESRVLIPKIYGKTLRLPPAAIVIALLVGGTLLGIVGALLALPVAAAIVMLSEELRVAMPGLTVDPSQKKRDELATQDYEERSANAPDDAAPVIAAAVASEVAAVSPEGEGK
jgi:predicted PurR-regulated permease PerM